jgi:hypothetical protein
MIYSREISKILLALEGNSSINLINRKEERDWSLVNVVD